MTMAAIAGPGNIGTDLLMKLLRTDGMEIRYMEGVDPSSDKIARAAQLGVQTSAEGDRWIRWRTRRYDHRLSRFASPRLPHTKPRPRLYDASQPPSAA